MKKLLLALPLLLVLSSCSLATGIFKAGAYTGIIAVIILIVIVIAIARTMRKRG